MPTDFEQRVSSLLHELVETSSFSDSDLVVHHSSRRMHVLAVCGIAIALFLGVLSLARSRSVTEVSTSPAPAPTTTALPAAILPLTGTTKVTTVPEAQVALSGPTGTVPTAGGTLELRVVNNLSRNISMGLSVVLQQSTGSESWTPVYAFIVGRDGLPSVQGAPGELSDPLVNLPLDAFQTGVSEFVTLTALPKGTYRLDRQYFVADDHNVVETRAMRPFTFAVV